jgi:hypothetical protein
VCSSTCSVRVSGTLSKTLGAVVVDSEGDVWATGTLAKPLGALTLQATGDVDISGSVSRTLGPLTLAAEGDVSLTGTLNRTLGAMTLSGAIGVDANTAQLQKTLGGVMLMSRVHVGPPVYRLAFIMKL